MMKTGIFDPDQRCRKLPFGYFDGALYADKTSIPHEILLMIDTHCHVYQPDFQADIIEILDRAQQCGITDILMPAIDYVSRERMAALPHHAVRLHPMAGIHPCDVKGPVPEEALALWASQANVVAIGESGLDYYWSTDFVTDQKAAMRLHCKLARELDKPLVLHNRDSTDDLLEIMTQEQDGRLRGVWHCFNGTAAEGRRALDLGFHLGIGGVVTFKNSGLDETIAQLPLAKLVLETDAPYLSPVPHRGKRNEPSYTQLVAIKLSEIYQCTLSEIDAVTTSTARKLFGI